jgi:hypothetical protein
MCRSRIESVRRQQEKWLLDIYLDAMAVWAVQITDIVLRSECSAILKSLNNT